jgi:ribonuclease HI
VRYLRAYPLYFLKDDLSNTILSINTDGAARGNPGPAAIGVVIKDDRGQIVATISRRIGKATNNQAEYRAIIAGLERAVKLGARQVRIFSDSELAVKQINGRYRVKKASLRELYEKVVKLAGALESFSITHVRRAKSSAADSLANQALDRLY